MIPAVPLFAQQEGDLLQVRAGAYVPAGLTLRGAYTFTAPQAFSVITASGAISAVGLSSSSGLTVSSGATAVQAITCTTVTASGSGVFGAAALLASERLRVAGGTMGTPGATDVLLAAGRVYAGDTSATSIQTAGGVTAAGNLSLTGAGSQLAVTARTTSADLTSQTTLNSTASLRIETSSGGLTGHAITLGAAGTGNGSWYIHGAVTGGTQYMTVGNANGTTFNKIWDGDQNGTGPRFYAGSGGSNAVQASVDSSGINLATGKVLRVNAVQVVAARNTGWTAQTAGASKADLGAAPTVGQLASFCRSLYDALATHGLIGT
jgi:hypothetical protein